MARTEKSRSVAIDDNTVGSAVTTRERTIAGALPPDFTAIGNGEKIAVGSSYGAERVIAGSALMLAERR
jgi:hypothetical protein